MARHKRKKYFFNFWRVIIQVQNFIFETNIFQINELELKYHI